ncbi:long-chain fatty acid--CoA ligase [Pseudomaricurvus alkylphenolicus]|jgi:long-chain acyl-CoA synthetase|uniref:acyl-CoA synthetase n=1 Tax=Pseudomaricurvus alkylphenolicus TaxID=1306991 RepID=UPI00141E100B|nr:long-chain fatty acid--CoA ligase [Pseudomaricurvus alkylphenolicus]NIB41533.1 long-chain fatty acid--CoA ligase [Pseudomaricurvus alkylphenolicus]
MISLQGMIERAARLNPNGTSTRYEEGGQRREHSWTELRDRIASLASGLQQFGLSEGDRVGILSLNSDRYYESLFAVPWAGYCVVPLNTRWALPENQYAVSDSGTRVLFFDDAFAGQAEQLLQQVQDLDVAIYMGNGDCPGWATSYEQLIQNHPPIDASSRGGDDMAGIFYTGGTTGFPKGVMQSHRAIWASTVGCLPDFEMTRDSLYLHVAPMFHMADFCASMVTTMCCTTHVFLQSFEPGQVLSTLAQEKISHVLLVPAMIKMVLNHPDASGTDVSALEKIMYGASPMPPATLEQCMAQWPGVGLAQAYGQTELAPVVTTLSSADHLAGGQRLKSAGRPTTVSDVRIVDDEGNDCPLGVSGEVVVRGPHTMIGYWNKPEETAKALQNGWVFTGDAGLFDENGYLYIVDRLKDMVVSGGENVFTTEVEGAVISHDAVQDVAVIGIPHDEWGEAVHAIVILHPGKSITEDQLIAHCRERIAGYKLPKSVTFREQPLPLSGAGKVLKTELRKPYWEGRDRQVN